MKDNKTAALRILAFFIDAALVVAALVGLLELLLFTNTIKRAAGCRTGDVCLCTSWLFVYWALNINLGKRIFKLVIVDELSGERPRYGSCF